MSEMMKFGASYGNGIAQRNWPFAASFTHMPPPSPTVITTSRCSPRRTSGLIHLTKLGSGATAVCTSTRSLIDVLVPVVARQMLVVPDELAGVGLQRDGRVAVEVGGRGRGNRVGVAAVPRRARVRHRIGDAPVDEPPHGIVVPGKPHVAATPLARRRSGPRLVARLARARVRCRNATPLCRSAHRAPRCSSSCARVAGAARDHFAFDDDRAGRVVFRRDRHAPAHLARSPRRAR